MTATVAPELDDTGKIVLDHIYDKPDPISYFATLAASITWSRKRPGRFFAIRSRRCGIIAGKSRSRPSTWAAPMA